jgi:hypothetical protein
LKQESSYDVEEPFFSVNQQKIVSLYDALHLLKSIRNALARYTIKYRDNKVAKFSHLISAFRFDQTRRFQTLRKIRECYLLVNKYKIMKMKVSIAAKTLSNTMVAATETYYYYCCIISDLKTSILNNLISNRSAGRNCEEDTGHILHNLRDFLSDNDNFKPLVEDAENELLHLNPPEFVQSCLENGNFELQALAYVCGYLVKTIKKLECPACRISLLVDTPESCHIFTQFKEYDDQKMRLKYVTKELICFVAHIHDMVIFYLKRFVHISNIVQKLRIVVIERTDFNWFQCNTHSSEI